MFSSQESVSDPCGSEIKRFLDAVQQHPCAYDTKRMDYRDAERKNNAWEHIRVYSSLSKVEDCLKQWKRLRDRYTREFKAIEVEKKSGSGYVSRRAWELAESMAFHKHCGRPRKTTCSLEPYGDDGETSESIFATMQDMPPSLSGEQAAAKFKNFRDRWLKISMEKRKARKSGAPGKDWKGKSEWAY
ncbi:hypothetical protein MTO96_022427 [Rhipicephalus appendiculatus]